MPHGLSYLLPVPESAYVQLIVSFRTMIDKQEVVNLIQHLVDETHREDALVRLSQRREEIEDLAPMLWHYPAAIAVLLQEIVSVYPCLAPADLDTATSNRVCNALALLQCIASHQDTRSEFLQGTDRDYL